MLTNLIDLKDDLIILFLSNYYYKKAITFLRRSYPKRFLSNPKALTIVIDLKTYNRLQEFVKIEILKSNILEVLD